MYILHLSAPISYELWRVRETGVCIVTIRNPLIHIRDSTSYMHVPTYHYINCTYCHTNKPNLSLYSTAQYGKVHSNDLIKCIQYKRTDTSPPCHAKTTPIIFAHIYAREHFHSLTLTFPLTST